MNDGIEFAPLGTVEVTFDDKTYHLGLPKMKQFRWFTRRLADVTAEATQEGRRLNAEIAAAQERFNDDDSSPEAKAEVDRLAEEVRGFTFFDRTAPITAEMFEQLGDPLPEEIEEWPVWLAADASIPGQILNHWRNAPKASGPTDQT
jgi:hypothetical protein